MLSIFKFKRKIFILILLVSILGVGTGFFIISKKNDSREEIQYEQVKVKKGDIVVGLDSDGVVEFSKVNLRFGVKGTIADILVKEGDEVKKGAIIAKLDDQDYQEEYQLAVAKLKDSQEEDLINLLNHELTLEKMKSELEKLKEEYQEMTLIPEAYSVSEIKMKKQEVDNKEREYQNAVKKHEILVNNYEDNELNQNELAVKIAQENLNDTILYSPVNGTVLKLAKKIGESLTDEQDFAVIHENNQYKIITKVIEYDISRIKVGQKVNITVEAIPDKKYVGEVSKIDALPTTDSSGLVSYQVEVDIKNPDSELKDGMTCMVTFVLKEVNNALIIPYKAVKIVNGKQLATVIEKGEMVEKEIKTGFTDGSSVEVLEGLEVNETVLYTKSR
ncbi:MAG: hypothetical protein PWP71_788 [Clostridia bacterium]|nr:hypothetical protein [Clostridia bacterium]